jgi:hypothetical protein
MSICFRCGKPFQLNQYSLGLVKPHCEECHLTKADIKAGVKIDITAPVMSATASRIGSDLRSRLDAAKASEASEVKSDIQMLTEDELL